MTDKIVFDLVSPERLLLSSEAEMITIPGTEGEMGVMACHMPLISTLRPGVISVSGGPNSNERYHVIAGFAEVTPHKLTVLAEEVMPASDLDGASLDARVRDAEKDLADAKNDGDRAKAKEILEYLERLRPAV